MFLNRYWGEYKRVKTYSPDPRNAFEVENVSFKDKNKTIVHPFSYKFKRRKVYAIIGASGSGKSTLALHFNGLMKSPKGNIFFFNGESIYFFKKTIPNFRAIRRYVGMVLQNPEYQLFKETVLEDVMCGLQMLDVPDSNPEERAKSKLRELGIMEEFFNRNPFMLSGGQKKKVALAGILVIDPEIVIFDEPVLGLDPYSVKKIVDIIQDLKNKNKTIIVISNNIDLILELSEEILVMDRGRLIMSGRPYLIFKDKRLNLGTPKVIKFLDKLTKHSPRFSSVWKDEPKNFEELASSIFNELRK
ncbi:Cobalt transporter ATP-binding subunit 2 [Mycoplasma haemocanis str. Illinois]|uniref:Cobalt transporter ATP-binding subunit 2 n=1 Tax=Mycoplasma haemocanis (strain Illinois) TaxID=1111676 RepID=H6N5K9_MYCHN|nr:ATP-binding cassette domain-containing protein [Mycoplasma haemocanis]AEW44969.1 Cobalt transporter ATP-binding subunit 2 [Mycoplasma haemocanis str. Illinois]